MGRRRKRCNTKSRCSTKKMCSTRTRRRTREERGRGASLSSPKPRPDRVQHDDELHEGELQTDEEVQHRRDELHEEEVQRQNEASQLQQTWLSADWRAP